MCEPIAQNYFGNSRFDDSGIGDDDRLIRHCRTPVQIVACEVNGFKVSDQALKNKPESLGTSIDLECLLAKDGHGPDYRFGAMPNTKALIAIETRSVRKMSLGAAWTPKPAEPGEIGAAASENRWHGEIVGRITPSQSRSLSSEWSVIRWAA